MGKYNVGDKVVVTNDKILGFYDGKMGIVQLTIAKDKYQVFFPEHDRTIHSLCFFSEDSLEPYEEEEIVPLQFDRKFSNLDDKIDTMENILKKYNLSARDSSGFMYVYDFLDGLQLAWHKFSEEDKADLIKCIVGE